MLVKLNMHSHYFPSECGPTVQPVKVQTHLSSMVYHIPQTNQVARNKVKSMASLQVLAVCTDTRAGIWPEPSLMARLPPPFSHLIAM